MFGSSRRRICITKGNKSSSIRKETDNNPGAAFSVDQLHSDQAGLVSQFSEKITSEHIWYAQVMVDHFSDLTYVHLVKRTIQEEKLSGNQPLKYGLPHSELKLIDIMQTMEDFLNNFSYQQLRIPTRQ